jgi:hypothetical protein
LGEWDKDAARQQQPKICKLFVFTSRKKMHDHTQKLTGRTSYLLPLLPVAVRWPGTQRNATSTAALCCIETKKRHGFSAPADQ